MTRDFQQAQQAVANLNKIVTKRIHDSIADIENELAKTRSFAKDSIKTTSVLIETSVSTSLKEIDSVKESAIDHGKDPKECIGTAEDDLKNIPVDTVNTIVNCINEELIKSEANVDKTSDQITGQLKVIFDLENKLADCDLGITGTACYLEVFTTATQQTATLPGKIVTLELGCTKQLDASNENIATCSFSKVYEVQNNVTMQAQQIVECISKL